jgi:hypothetical protein
MKKLGVFIFFLLSVMNPKLFGWEFYVYHTTDVVPQISVEEIQPFDLYAHDIKKTFFKNEKMPCGYYSGKIAVYYGELKKLPAENKRVYIFVVPHEIRSKGGQLKKKDTQETIKYVFVRENFSTSELCHELCHAIAGLGDEYAEAGGMFPENLKKPDGKTIYPNLTWYESDFEEWKEISDSEIYFPAGAGYDAGIFHAYENCLMKDLSEPLCPVCRFYLQKALDGY